MIRLPSTNRLNLIDLGGNELSQQNKTRYLSSSINEEKENPHSKKPSLQKK